MPEPAVESLPRTLRAHGRWATAVLSGAHGVACGPAGRLDALTPQVARELVELADASRGREQARALVELALRWPGATLSGRLGTHRSHELVELHGIQVRLTALTPQELLRLHHEAAAAGLSATQRHSHGAEVVVIS